MHQTILKIVLITLVLSLCSCGTYKQAWLAETETLPFENLPDTEAIESLFLVGDTGEGNDSDQTALFRHIQQKDIALTGSSSLVFLGDNIYPAGLPEVNDKKRTEAETIIQKQLEWASGLTAATYFIPGNHDWNHMKSGGRQSVLRQETYIENFGNDQIKFYPKNACNDPVVQEVTESLFYVFIDTQWWLQNWKKEEGMHEGCTVSNRAEFLDRMESIFAEHRNEQLVVLMHHPFYSNGEHGGHFDFKTNFFPLTYIKDFLYLPMPIIGSLMPVMRYIGAIDQDNTHPEYKRLIKGIEEAAKENDNVIFASGHDHTMQYTIQKGNHHIITGSGSKVNFARKGKDAKMVHSAKGYAMLRFYEEGAVWLEFFKVDAENKAGELIYRKEIVGSIKN